MTAAISATTQKDWRDKQSDVKKRFLNQNTGDLLSKNRIQI